MKQECHLLFVLLQEIYPTPFTSGDGGDGTFCSHLLLSFLWESESTAHCSLLFAFSLKSLIATEGGSEVDGGGVMVA